MFYPVCQSADVENFCHVEISNSHSYRLSQSLKHSLSVSQTLSKFKHRNHSNAHCQTLTVLGVQRNYPHHQTLSPFLRPHSDDPLTHPLKSLKRSPSNAHRPRRATKLPSPSNALPFPQTTFRRFPHPSLENPFCPYQRKFRFCFV